LSHAITRVSKIKREWLAFLGLYPPRQNAPMFRALNLLLRAPQEFRTALLDLLQLFWQKVFHETWQSMESMLERSMEEKERLFQSCSLEEFARLALLRVEIDERKGILKAARGGYILSLKHLEKAVVLPSAFNDKRHWTCEDSNPQSVVAYFPYFDPAISPTRIRDAEGAETPEPDPALILKALGDTTRYAMVSLLAKEPLTSSDLAKTMSLTRATVSHHIHVLRDAGLIEDTVQGNSILLSLKRRVLEDLSALIIEKLFHTREILLKKTRTA